MASRALIQAYSASPGCILCRVGVDRPTPWECLINPIDFGKVSTEDLDKLDDECFELQENTRPLTASPMRAPAWTMCAAGLRRRVTFIIRDYLSPDRMMLSVRTSIASMIGARTLVSIMGNTAGSVPMLSMRLCPQDWCRESLFLGHITETMRTGKPCRHYLVSRFPLSRSVACGSSLEQEPVFYPLSDTVLNRYPETPACYPCHIVRMDLLKLHPLRFNNSGSPESSCQEGCYRSSFRPGPPTQSVYDIFRNPNEIVLPLFLRCSSAFCRSECSAHTDVCHRIPCLVFHNRGQSSTGKSLPSFRRFIISPCHPRPEYRGECDLSSLPACEVLSQRNTLLPSNSFAVYHMFAETRY